MGIGSRLTVRERRLPSEWWKPWDPSHASAGQVRTVANTALEPHGGLQSYAEACRCLDVQDWEGATRDENEESHQQQHMVTSPKTQQLQCNRIKMGFQTQLQCRRHHRNVESQTH